MSLICIDIILRALMIEPPKNKASQGAVSIPDESEPLLRNGNGQPRYDEPAECPTQSLNQGRERRFTVPPILRLIMSRQLLVVLFASVIDSVLYNMFEAVSPSRLVSLRTESDILPQKGASCLCDQDLPMVLIRNRHVLLRIGPAVSAISGVWYEIFRVSTTLQCFSNAKYC